MHAKLAEALGLLGVNDIQLRDETGKVTQVISPKEHARALFTYLNLAGYFSDSLLQQSVEYLSASKSFECDKEIVLNDLKKVCASSNRNGKFDADFFMDHFAEQNYFSVSDIIDLIVFLQQTAFDRRFGVERDRLEMKPWMESPEFKACATKLGIITPIPPTNDRYPAAGIMGASSKSVRKRLEYFRDLKIDCDFVWALSGKRELSKGLDEEELMQKVAEEVKKPIHYVKKNVGVDTREFLDGVTETMMVNYLIQTICPNQKIGMVDSVVEGGHWRATSAQSAADIVPIILNKIESQEIKNTNNNQYQFLIITEQPYALRMAKQVQREFNKELEKRGLIGTVKINVEGCGPGVSENELFSKGTLTRLNSELGALMAERYIDARTLLQQKQPELQLRDPNIIMFSKRDETYKTYLNEVQYKPSIRLC